MPSERSEAAQPRPGLTRRELLATVPGHAAAVMVAARLSSGQEPAGTEPALLAHWPLGGDARDIADAARHGAVRNVDFGATGPDGRPRTAARFDGRNSVIEIPGPAAPRIGRDDFTVACWVHTDAALDDDLGDLVSQFDPDARQGFSLGFAHGNVACSQANARNLVFGIDQGTKPVWTDRGRPGQSVYSDAMTVFDGRLYVGTCEPQAGQSGRVYRYAGGAGEAWEDVGSPDPCNAVAALAVHEGALFAGVSRYRLAGSALPESPNRAPGGKVYRLGNDGRWIDCGKLGDAEAIGGLAIYRGRLYASSAYSPGVYRYEGGQRWAFCGAGPGNRRIVALGVYNGDLYGASYDGGRVYRYEGGEAWSLAGEIPGATQTYGFATYGGRWHVSTWPKGEVYRLDERGGWSNLGQLGGEKEVMGMAAYNGKLYAGTLPLAQVYRFDGPGRWALTGQLDATPDVRYRRAWSLTVFDGKLFCGTLPSGRIHSLEAGQCTSHDRPLAPGWRHVAAIRRGGRLELHVDGRLDARSAPAGSTPLDLTTGRPLLIGRGPQDSFRGLLSDLRVYRGALSPAAIARIAARG